MQQHSGTLTYGSAIGSYIRLTTHSDTVPCSISVCRHLVRSMVVDKVSGLITFTSRVPPKLLRDCQCCCQCGGPVQPVGLLGLQALAEYGPDWELALDPTAAGRKPVMRERMCMDCMTGGLQGCKEAQLQYSTASWHALHYSQ